jgi:ABC-type polysaccharide/polyol phosphate transport system ATPase subunit
VSDGPREWERMNNAIDVVDVHKVYHRYGRRKRFATLKSALLSGDLLREFRSDDVFQALRGVSFTVEAGRTFGIIGRNGSGKSTMLKLLAGIGKPSSGTVRVNGRVSALIELGAGFHPEISGRDNVFINGMMLGLTRREIAQRFDEIVAFAELSQFIDEPVKSYSSGMYMRLGFAVAVHVDPAVLLVDEVLAVGDESFTHKCLDKFADFKRQGKTILLVTHQLDLVQRFCDDALWLDHGVVRAQGDPKRVIDAYLLDVAGAENKALGDAGGATALAVANNETRWGSREVEITAVELRGASGATHTFAAGEPAEICFHVHAAAPVTDFVFGIGIFNAEGVCCYGTNTQLEGATPGELRGDAEVRFAIESLDLVAGTYTLDVAVHRENGAPYDYHRKRHTFRVNSQLKDVGVYRPRHHWVFGGGVTISGLE